MNCFMFPGQPLARATALPDDPDFAGVSELVRRTAHLDLESFHWLSGEGSENVKLQLFGVAQSLYDFRRLRRSGIVPHLVMQHSMGIYSALAACGSVCEEQAIEITWRVGITMARMAEKERYALGCVIGLTGDKVLALARNNRVYLANHNTSRHFLLCGRKRDMTAALAEAFEHGAFSVRTFDCDAPLHTPLMESLEQELKAIFTDYRYREPACPLMDHLEQRYLTAREIAPFMLRELCRPVYWDKTYRAARSAGGKDFFEVGAGDSLKKYNRWIEADIEA
jgi:[acyl-carrier-protein] S-malonyltransferase